MFRIGDLITGTDDNPYRVTNKYYIMEVTEVSEDLITVIVPRYSEDCDFTVESKYFTLIKRKPTFKEL